MLIEQPPFMINEANRQSREFEEPTLSSTGVLINKEGNIATFMAVYPDLLHGAAFSSKFKQNRMSWIKTSLAWSMWKADQDRQRSHSPVRESIIEIDVEPRYFQDLLASSVGTKKVEKGATPKLMNVLRQRDPDRQMVLTSTGSFSEFPRRRGEFRSTLHIGVRGNALSTFIEQAAGRIKVLDEIIEEASRALPNASGVIPENGSVSLSPWGNRDNLEADLYGRLGLSKQSLREVLKQ